MGVPILTLPGYEADDILGTVAKRSQKEGIEVSVVSGDRDLLQLADEHIKIRLPKTSRGGTEVHDYYPVSYTHLTRRCRQRILSPHRLPFRHAGRKSFTTLIILSQDNHFGKYFLH